MPALAFGLNAAKSRPGLSQPQKRKAFFDGDDEDEVSAPAPQHGPKKAPRPPIKPLSGFDDDDDDDGRPPRKSPKLAQTSGLQKPSQQKPKIAETNLSALRTAKLHDAEASKIDASVYDYDAAYETFHPTAPSKAKDATSSGPKYMTSLLATAKVRERDHLRAKEKALQREREAEGDEFADKEKFVTSGYKAQQEENRRLEEEERKRQEEEEELRRKGGGMTAFHKRMLQKDEERMQMIAEAEKTRAEHGSSGAPAEGAEDADENKIARELNEKGAHIVVNDDGEVVDKRQLLSAGLNVAPKKPSAGGAAPASRALDRDQPYQRSAAAHDARLSQRERQSRMMERQIEEMERKAREAEEHEEKERAERNKTNITEETKMGAKERYLARKKEREAEAAKKKAGGGGGG